MLLFDRHRFEKEIMTEDEYIEFLTYLFDEYVRERLPSAEYYFDKYCFEGRSAGYTHRRLQKAVLMSKYIYTTCDEDEEILRTFTKKVLHGHIEEVMRSCNQNTRLLERIGILDCLQSHYREIVNGMNVSHFPDLDTKILAELGSRDPALDLKGIIYSNRAKAQQGGESANMCDIDVKRRLKRVEEMVESALGIYQDDKNKLPSETPKKPRRWFKGLGNIGQGTALSLGNIGLAIGAFGFPVSPETQTWGAIVSATTGVGMIMNGVGELRNE